MTQEEIIEELRVKANRCVDITKEGRARKGAYVDCLVMLNALNGTQTPWISVEDGLPEGKPLEWFICANDKDFFVVMYEYRKGEGFVAYGEPFPDERIKFYIRVADFIKPPQTK